MADSIPLSAKIYDKGEFSPELSELVRWIILPEYTQAYLRVSKGANNTFYGTNVYTTLSIIAIIIDPEDSLAIFTDSLKVYVRPSSILHLNIEASADSSISEWRDNRIGTLTFSSTALKDSVYAVLRDQYCNWVGRAANVTWQTRNEEVVKVTSGQSRPDEGIITRETSSDAMTYVIATQGNYTDSVQVVFQKPVNIAINPMIKNPCLISGTNHFQLTIYNMLGKKINQGLFDTKKSALSAVSGMIFLNGIYVLTFRQKDIEETTKVTISK